MAFMEKGMRVFWSKGGKLVAVGDRVSSIAGLRNISLTGCDISFPVGAAFDATLEGVAKAGALVKEQVVIGPSVFKVTVDAAVAHGKLTATPEKDVAVGAEVTLAVKPDDGYRLKKGSLKAYKTGDEAVTVEVKGNKFSMPAHDVRVTCVFEKKPAPAPVEEEKPLAVESELLSEVQLQPNPFDDFLELTGLEHAMRIEVVSLLGQTKYTQPLGGQPSLRLETGNWPAGLYMVKLLDGDGGSVVLRGERR